MMLTRLVALSASLLCASCLSACNSGSRPMNELEKEAAEHRELKEAMNKQLEEGALGAPVTVPTTVPPKTIGSVDENHQSPHENHKN
jgi:hypothetical protein